MNERIYSLEELDCEFAIMTDTQYRTARDAGFSKDELIDADHYWYKANHDKITNSKNKKEALTAPPLPKQLEFLARRTSIDPSMHYLYIQCRAKIRAIAKKDDDDERYIRLIETQQKLSAETKAKNNAERNTRGRGDKPGKPKLVVDEETQFLQQEDELGQVIIESDAPDAPDDDDEEDSIDAIYQRHLKKLKNQQVA